MQWMKILLRRPPSSKPRSIIRVINAIARISRIKLGRSLLRQKRYAEGERESLNGYRIFAAAGGIWLIVLDRQGRLVWDHWDEAKRDVLYRSGQLTGLKSPVGLDLYHINVDDLGADSLAYLSLDGVYEAIGTPAEDHCDACFTGRYPLGENANGKFALEQLTTVPAVTR